MADGFPTEDLSLCSWGVELAIRRFPYVTTLSWQQARAGTSINCQKSLQVAAANCNFHHIYACDFSAKAVQLLKSSSGFQHDRMTAFVADVTVDDLTKYVPEATVDVVTCIFVLSACDPVSLPQVCLLTSCDARKNTFFHLH